MPRQKTESKADLEVLCQNCGGRGTIGVRNGQQVPCPACNGSGGVTDAAWTYFSNRETRRRDAYQGPTIFEPGGYERSRISVASLLANLGDDPNPFGPITTQPVIDQRGRQRFRIVSGSATAAAAVRAGESAVDVEVDPLSYGTPTARDTSILPTDTSDEPR